MRKLLIDDEAIDGIRWLFDLWGFDLEYGPDEASELMLIRKPRFDPHSPEFVERIQRMNAQRREDQGLETEPECPIPWPWRRKR
jgi:hypothetical protein